MVQVKLKNLYMFIALLLVSTPTVAAESLLSLYQAALNFDAKYKATLADTQADREELEKARASFYPKAQLSGSIGRGNTDRTTQSLSGAIDSHINYNMQNIALTIKQPIFNKEAMATYKAAEAFVQSKEYLLRDETSTLILKIAKSYLELLYAQEKLNVLQNQLSALGQQLNQAKMRYQHGVGTITEVSEAQSSLDIAQADLIDAENSVESFRIALMNATGHDIKELAPLNREKLLSLNKSIEQLDYWLNLANENNLEINAAKYSVAAAQQEVEKKNAGHFPTLDLVGARSYSENDSNNTIGAKFDTTSIALQFNVPIYAGGYVSASARQALNKVDAAKENLNLKTRDADSNIRKYFQELKSEFQSIRAYSQAVKSSEISLDGTSKSYAGGLRTNIDVLNAQQKLYESKLKLTKSYFVLLNNFINIHYVAGSLNEAQLQNINDLLVTN